MTQDTTFLPSFLSSFDVKGTSKAESHWVFVRCVASTFDVHSLVFISCCEKMSEMVVRNFDGALNILSIVPVETGHTVIPPGVVGGFPVLLPQVRKYLNNSCFKGFSTCLVGATSLTMLLRIHGFTRRPMGIEYCVVCYLILLHMGCTGLVAVC